MRGKIDGKALPLIRCPFCSIGEAKLEKLGRREGGGRVKEEEGREQTRKLKLLIISGPV